MTEDQDRIDAERWRKIAQVLQLRVEQEERWEAVQVSKNRRTEERVIEWQWNLDIHPDHSWKLYGSTKDGAKVPKSLDEFIDRLVL
jgi:hypothetical protein